MASEDPAKAIAGRSVIQTGDVSIRVDDPAKSAEAVTALAEDLGGYVQSQTIGDAGGYGDGGYAGDGGASLQLRIPSERLDEAFRRFADIGHLTSQSRSSDDVTAEHVDLQARVKALETSVARLTKLMAAADSTADLLEAENALSQRQQELDGLRAQLKSLEGQVSEASVSVTLHVETALPGGPANFWEGLVAGWDSLGTAGAGALVLVGILLPWLALAAAIGAIVLLVVRARRRAKRRGLSSLVGDEDGGVPVQALTAEEGAGSGPQAPQEHQDEAQRD